MIEFPVKIDNKKTDMILRANIYLKRTENNCSQSSFVILYDINVSLEGITSAEGSSADRPSIFVNLITDFRDAAGDWRSAFTKVEIGFIDVERPLGRSSRTGVVGREAF